MSAGRSVRAVRVPRAVVWPGGRSERILTTRSGWMRHAETVDELSDQARVMPVHRPRLPMPTAHRQAEAPWPLSFRAIAEHSLYASRWEGTGLVRRAVTSVCALVGRMVGHI